MPDPELEMEVDELCNLNTNRDPTEKEMYDIYCWIDHLEFTRPKRNISRDFSDGVLMAELISTYLPRFVELRYYYPGLSKKNKTNNWEHLNMKVFSKLGYKIGKQQMNEIMESAPGAIEKVLFQLRTLIARKNRSILNYRVGLKPEIPDMIQKPPSIPSASTYSTAIKRRERSASSQSRTPQKTVISTPIPMTRTSSKPRTRPITNKPRTRPITRPVTSKPIPKNETRIMIAGNNIKIVTLEPTTPGGPATLFPSPKPQQLQQQQKNVSPRNVGKSPNPRQASKSPGPRQASKSPGPRQASKSPRPGLASKSPHPKNKSVDDSAKQSISQGEIVEQKPQQLKQTPTPGQKLVVAPTTVPASEPLPVSRPEPGFSPEPKIAPKPELSPEPKLAPEPELSPEPEHQEPTALPEPEVLPQASPEPEPLKPKSIQIVEIFEEEPFAQHIEAGPIQKGEPEDGKNDNSDKMWTATPTKNQDSYEMFGEQVFLSKSSVPKNNPDGETGVETVKMNDKDRDRMQWFAKHLEKASKPGGGIAGKKFQYYGLV